MDRLTNFYIDGQWAAPLEPNELEVINPADETPFAVVSMGSEADLDRAVKAADKAFITWSQSTPEDRIALLAKLGEVYERRYDEMADAISKEMGAPKTLAKVAQAAAGLGPIKSTIEILKTFPFEHKLDPNDESIRILREPIGVVGLITPWNWPMNQVSLKVVPAVAAGCTMVLKPSEIAPISSMLFAEMMDEAGFPAGVFNLVNGEGPVVGEAMARHPDITMMSLTGSTRAGIAVTKASADTVKRVTLELGGKSPNIVFADSDLPKAVTRGVRHCFNNTGQSCNAPTRMLVERTIYEDAVDIARQAAESTEVGDPAEEGRHIGPLVSETQYNKVQGLIEAGIDEGARLVIGGPGRPEGFNRGYYVRPTIFADVNNDMTIAREEIFGPVLAMIPFESEDEAVAIANDTDYGLAAYVQTGDPDRAKRVSRKLRAGNVQINGQSLPDEAPFGGYKESGNGREGGVYGLEEFLETKAVSGWTS